MSERSVPARDWVRCVRCAARVKAVETWCSLCLAPLHETSGARSTAAAGESEPAVGGAAGWAADDEPARAADDERVPTPTRPHALVGGTVAPQALDELVARLEEEVRGTVGLTLAGPRAVVGVPGTVTGLFAVAGDKRRQAVLAAAGAGVVLAVLLGVMTVAGLAL